MKSKLILLCVLLPLLVAAQCNPGPLTPPAPTPAPVAMSDAAPPVTDAAPAPQPDIDPGVRDACANLAALHCAEGGPSCPGVMQKALNERLTAIPLDCLVAAHSKADVHACGPFVACP